MLQYYKYNGIWLGGPGCWNIDHADPWDPQNLVRNVERSSMKWFIIKNSRIPASEPLVLKVHVCGYIRAYQKAPQGPFRNSRWRVVVGRSWISWHQAPHQVSSQGIQYNIPDWKLHWHHPLFYVKNENVFDIEKREKQICTKNDNWQTCDQIHSYPPKPSTSVYVTYISSTTLRANNVQTADVLSRLNCNQNTKNVRKLVNIPAITVTFWTLAMWSCTLFSIWIVASMKEAFELVVVLVFIFGNAKTRLEWVYRVCCSIL